MEGGVTVIQTGELFYLRFSQLYVLWFAIVPSGRGKGEETGNWRGVLGKDGRVGKGWENRYTVQ